MDFYDILGYFLALLVGFSLGLVGSGGSILTVPILVYVLGFDALIATGYSLFIVGTTALVGAIRSALHKGVHFRIVALFGIPSLVTAYMVRAYLLPSLPDTLVLSSGVSIGKSLLLMLLFAVVMLVAAVKMIKPSTVNTSVQQETAPIKLMLSGVLIGLLAGAVGAGGGFLIIPALLFLAKLPMKEAVGTSLFIVAIQSLAGFTGTLHQEAIEWGFLLRFSGIAVIGVFIGIYAATKIAGERLKTGFGYFVLAMACYILTKELFFS
ncbi:sulfite exporter TauE/SafE family protein [Flavobacterium sp. JP2137]|uniref:sulfite exporter TauE/SafE family protein n=1 Tax=Flavobacterium sp. JP2137 TaxID=3414510 RepID=UPI003D2FD7DC